mmetsp:Transcript_36274/g.43809  ORF Transcript_36274/g.43809 Transcript_36274/m.43809 type:complete len:177 (+) Transcript_36274:170-700(+)|eukprot:CAMPEP_0197849748 /NCGR_PEP_ID=MMETSP1438-20131217/13116_1 /TAXON_ID=1461541 /ORGANISM="Pterosperma sp., Strain CCMP1384" /LENGTH=176 /DNA_ID=CAMNT_0043462579 /DNA_START=84 /DNA_END=614 /DNA_ORIENTATION=-
MAERPPIVLLSVGATVGIGIGLYLGYKIAQTATATAEKTWSDSDDDDASLDAPLIRTDVEYKMILCVRNDLKMSKGKIAAQCSHATLGLYEEVQDLRYFHLIEHWQSQGQAKVAIKVEDEKEMLEIEAKARQAGIETYIVVDAGRTQIAPNSRTVLALGPAPKDELDAVTGHLKLL